MNKQANTTKRPIARITTYNGRVVGEIKGAPDAIEKVGILAHSYEPILGCRFETSYLGDDTLEIRATPQKWHRIKAPEGKPAVNPERALLHTIFNCESLLGGSVLYNA